jgi:hypothetical protein
MAQPNETAKRELRKMSDRWDRRQPKNEWLEELFKRVQRGELTPEQAADIVSAVQSDGS